MAQLMLVNPRKRKPKRTKKKMATRRRRTAAQKRATRRLVALNRKRRSLKRNPKRRRRRVAKVKTYARSRATGRRPTARLVRRRRRNNRAGYYPNPRRRRTTRGMFQNIMRNQVQPAAIQATGAIGLDIVYGYFGQFIPAQLNTGMLRHVTKGVIALGLGFVASNFVRNQTANNMSRGALTVVMHDAFREALAQWMPAIPLGDMGYYNVSPVYNPNSPMGYFETQPGSGYAPHSLGYFSQDMGAGYYSPRAESEVFDTSDI